MITGAQVRAARSALKWSADELANRAGIAAKTVRRIEVEDGLSNSTMSTLNALRSTLEAAGIEFIGTPDNDPGIRIKTRK